MMMKTSAAMPIDPVNESAARAAMPIIIPAEPTMSSGLRPTRSTVKIATTVKRILTTPITTVWSIEASPDAPIPAKMRGA